MIFHNLRGCDSHLIFYEVKKFDVKIDVIPNGLEKYISFILKKNLVFIDSRQFMHSSFEKLVKNLSDNDLKCLIQEFGSKNLELLKQKDAYPYEYMNSFKKVSKEKLHDEKYFYSFVKDGTTGYNGEKLNDHVSDKDYLTCIKIWNEFNMKNMRHYHDHYFKKGVLLLADIFEKYMDTCLKFYKRDSCHYFSSPRLSWNAMLKITGVELEKISDIDMYLFIEK